jgi:hypothetical protein
VQRIFQRHSDAYTLESSIPDTYNTGWTHTLKARPSRHKPDSAELLIRPTHGLALLGLISLQILGNRRLSPDLPRGTVNLIGGELDVDDPRLRTNRTPQSLHHCSVGYHPRHTNDLATKAYPCKRNQEYKQEQEMQSNRLDYEVESHKPMNGDTVHGQIESKQNPNPKVATTTK